MIKLKSLFRRGQGPSGSSKHSSSNSRHKSQSTTSLNTVGSSSQEPAAATAAAAANTATFYPPIDPLTERGVDVGDGDLNIVAPLAARTRSRTPEALRHANNNSNAAQLSGANSANTLPHKKPKVAGTGKKGQKQPKQLPTTATAQPQAPPARAEVVVAAAPVGNVMTTIAAAPGSHNSAVNTAAAAAAAAAATNNNYTGGELISASIGQVPLPTPAEAGIDLYKLNAANYQQFINNEQLLQQQQQQQQQLLEVRGEGATTQKYLICFKLV